jgi:hypothetical protein
VRRSERLHLTVVVVIVVAVLSGIAFGRYQRAHWVGTEPLPTFLAGDGPYYRATLLSMIEDLDLDVRNQFAVLQYSPASNASLGTAGQWYPKHPIVLPLVSAPFFLAASDPGLLAANIGQLGLLTMVMWILSRRFSTPLASSIATLVFMLGTILRPAAYNWSPDVLSTFITIGALVAIVNHRMAIAGGLLALSVWAKTPNLVLVPIACGYALYISTSRERIRLIVALSAGLALFGAWNWSLFGSPLTTSYDRVIASVVNRDVVLEPSHRTFFDVNLVRGIVTQITDGRNGLLVAASPLVPALLGLIALYQRDRAASLLIGSLMTAQILTFGSYRLWDQSNFGPRFLLTVIALGAVPFSALIDSLRPGPPAAESANA